MPSIRPNSTVRFKDTSGTLLYQTGADVFLSALDEKTPAVKTITVNVPARDGVLDLTESVAGRPLYGNRSIIITLSVLKADHPSAVAEVRAMRRAIHGQMCRVETPDNIIPDSSTTIPGATIQGWYLGRVSIGEVKYPGEAAVVKITVDAQPWIYYGTGTVTLTHSAPTSYTIGALASADQSRISEAVIEIGQVAGTTWDTTANYTTAGYIPTSVALVLSRTENLLEYGTMAEWRASKLDSSNPWAIGWFDEDTDLTSAEVSIVAESTDEAHRRALVAINGEGYPMGVMTTGEQDTYHININFQVTADGGTKLGKASGVYLFVQEIGNLYLAPVTGYIDYQTSPTYTTIWKTGDSLNTLSVDVWNYTPNRSGFAVIGVEARWVEAIVSVRVEKVPTAFAAGYTGHRNADNSIAYLDAPEPLYSTSTKRNTVTIAPYGTSETVELRVPSNSTTATAITAETSPMQSASLDGPAKYVRAYGLTNYGWMCLQADTDLYPWSTATFDAGDMPTTFEVTLGSPTAFSKGGTVAVMTDSGTLPLAVSGSSATLDYMVMGSNDGTLTYEQGTV